ncbi:hypothetical protein [Marinicella meishanensis]|uniref:hypothetical protein n=1 Tax=Marinicella meishanensis TaxID=2873263 RepID=UPI001CBF4A7B|nr:hypothetical protein [Marinicella sp. NBU2979]
MKSIGIIFVLLGVMSPTTLLAAEANPIFVVLSVVLAPVIIICLICFGIIYAGKSFSNKKSNRNDE